MTILIIERSKTIREFLKEFLCISGFRTIATNCPIEAIELVRARRPRIIMAEYDLPSVEGFDLTKAVKSFREESGKIFLILNSPLVFLPQTVLKEINEEIDYEDLLGRKRAEIYGVDMVFAKPLIMQRVLPYLSA